MRLNTALLLIILALLACNLAFQIYIYVTDPSRQFVVELLSPILEDHDSPPAPAKEGAEATVQP